MGRKFSVSSFKFSEKYQNCHRDIRPPSICLLILLSINDINLLFHATPPPDTHTLFAFQFSFNSINWFISVYFFFISMISSIISFVKHNNRVASNNDFLPFLFSRLLSSREHNQNWCYHFAIRSLTWVMFVICLFYWWEMLIRWIRNWN